MNITVDERTKNLILTDVNLAKKNFSASRDLSWDQWNDGTQRKFNINLTKEEADYFASIGAKVVCLPPTKDFQEPAYFVQVNVSYKGKTPPDDIRHWNVFYNGPMVDMIVNKGGTMVRDRLTEKTIKNLDDVHIVKFDCVIRPGAAKKGGQPVIRENGVPGVTLYAQEIYATVEKSKLEMEYAGIPLQYDDDFE